MSNSREYRNYQKKTLHGELAVLGAQELFSIESKSSVYLSNVLFTPKQSFLCKHIFWSRHIDFRIWTTSKMLQICFRKLRECICIHFSDPKWSMHAYAFTRGSYLVGACICIHVDISILPHGALRYISACICIHECALLVWWMHMHSLWYLWYPGMAH